jgi:hypothetical protein
MPYDLDPGVITFADILLTTIGIVVALWLVVRWSASLSRD